jgi:hypothetical protein
MVVKKFNLSEEEIKKLYEEVRKVTENFTKFKPEVLAENSQRILIFRLALGLSITNFAKLCNRSHGSIENLEKLPKQLNYRVASHYINVISKNLHNADFSLEKILQTLRNFRERALKGISIESRERVLQFARKGALKSLEKRKSNEREYFKASLEGLKKQQLTNQERKIKEILDRNKISYRTHEFICSENVDFIIDDKNNKKIILIGCSSSKPSNITSHARRLMYQAYRIKYHLKDRNVFYIAVLGTPDGSLKKSELPKGAVRLLEEICDIYFVDENVDEIIKFIKELIGPPESYTTSKPITPTGHESGSPEMGSET